MPVPTWDCPELGLMDEPVDTTTVVSEDIWKKFDLDFPQPFSADRYYGIIEDGIKGEPYDRSTSSGGGSAGGLVYEKSVGSISSFHFISSSRAEVREIRHHDCMWAGLCISKEHNRTHPAKKDVQIQKKVPAGRSLLINRSKLQTQQGVPRNPTNATSVVKNLESDGDSTRPETPQSSESESDESEDEIPTFRHDSISINDKLSEYVGTEAPVNVSEVTGQLVCRRNFEKKNFNNDYGSAGNRNRQDTGYRNSNATTKPDNNVTNPSYTTANTANTTCTSTVSLGDHCYHLNQTTSGSKKLEHLGVQTPSDSEEEIDVVTFDKPCRPASLPTNPSFADKQHLQKTVTSALKDKSPPRPRGRPPSNGARKRSAQAEPKPAKRPKHKTSYQKRGGGNKTSAATAIQNSKNFLERNDIGKSSSRLIESCRVSSTESAHHQILESSTLFGVKSERNDNHDLLSSPCKGSGSSKSSSSASRSTSSDEEPDTEKRSLHNNMERQRRIELRNAFEELRVLVPAVEMKEKAPKVVILREAAVYCDLITELEQTSVATVNELKRRQDRLRTKLSQLRRNFRSERRVAAAHK